MSSIPERPLHRLQQHVSLPSVDMNRDRFSRDIHGVVQKSVDPNSSFQEARNIVTAPLAFHPSQGFTDLSRGQSISAEGDAYSSRGEFVSNQRIVDSTENHPTSSLEGVSATKALTGTALVGASVPYSSAALSAVLNTGVATLTTGSLQALAALSSVVAAPAAGFFAGRMLGKTVNKPVTGAYMGAGAGMVAAPLAHATMLGVPATAAASYSLTMLASLLPTAAVAGVAGAGIYAWGKRKMRKHGKEPTSTLSTMAYPITSLFR